MSDEHPLRLVTWTTAIMDATHMVPQILSYGKSKSENMAYTEAYIFKL